MIALIAHGLASPLGPAEIAGTALAAGLSRAAQIAHAPVLGVGEDAAPAVGHAILEGDDDHGGRCRRLVALARSELGPVQADATLLCRALPDAVRWGPDVPADLPADEVFALGHAAPAAALVRAEELITRRTCRRVLVVAVDSLLDPASLAWLAAHDRLRGSGTPDGVAPGEAAVCWLLGPADPAALAQVSASFQPAEAARSARDDAARWLRAAGELPAGRDWLDLTGEPWRARAWGALAHRLQRHLVLTPADDWGDLGAASALAMGSAGLAMGIRPAVIWSLAEDGAAGVITLR